MANNLMFLVHIPTGLAICLGKRTGYGWASKNNPVQKLFEVLESDYDYGGGKQDDFALAMEDAEGSTFVIEFYGYGKERNDGLVQLIVEEPK